MPSKKIAQNDLDELIDEEEKKEIKATNAVKHNEMNELISEITAEEKKPQIRRLQNNAQFDLSHDTHVKLFGSKVGQKSTMPSRQEKWDANSEPRSDF